MYHYHKLQNVKKEMKISFIKSLFSEFLKLKKQKNWLS